MQVHKEKAYIAFDGTKFATKVECKTYENENFLRHFVGLTNEQLVDASLRQTDEGKRLAGLCEKLPAFLRGTYQAHKKATEPASDPAPADLPMPVDEPASAAEPATEAVTAASEPATEAVTAASEPDPAIAGAEAESRHGRNRRHAHA